MNDKTIEAMQIEALLDELIYDNPDVAERLIESQLARLELRKRLNNRKANFSHA